MKKLLLTALISTSIFGLAACGGKITMKRN